MAAKKKEDSYQCLADSLAEESLSEAAEHFFGQRRGIEEALRDYQGKVARLRELRQRVDSRLGGLHFLLGRNDPDTVDGFYRRLGLDPEEVPRPEPDIPADLADLRVPFGLTRKARFRKLLLRAYAAATSEARDFMDGRYYDDPQDPRCKRVTVNYRQVKALSEALRERIRQANQYDTFSEVLQFSKRLDVERSGKESLVGAPLHYTLDQEMAFKPPDFESSGLAAYPDFPAPERVRRAVRDYGGRLARQSPREVRAMLREVKAAGEPGRGVVRRTLRRRAG